MTETRDKWLYLVAGERNINNDVVKYANVGDAFDVESRLKDVDYARKAAGGNWVVLGKWNIGQHRDHEIHPLLKKRGLRFDPDDTGNTEEVAFRMPIVEALRIVGECVNECLFGIKRKNSFLPRKEQSEAIEKATTYLKSPGSEFLLNAKMRFGKCFVTYKIVQALQPERVLVVTGRPAVLSSWLQDITDHIDFDGWGVKWHGHSARDVIATIGKPTIEFVSFQYLHYDIQRAKDLAGIDLLVNDEAHYATETVLAKSEIEALSPRKILHLSGTPYRKLSSGKFTNANTYSWSYIDERKTCENEGAGESYKCIPKMNLFTIDIAKAAKKKVFKQFTEDEQFNFEKFFKANDGKFFEETNVKEFLKLIRPVSKGGQRGISLWYPKEIEASSLEHQVWFLPSVSAVTAMSRLLQVDAYWKDHVVLVATGADTNAFKMDAINNHIEAAVREDKKTVTLTCERLKEGVTIPRWGVVLMLNGWHSAVNYWQAAFRPQSICVYEKDVTGKPVRWKSQCYVFDFNPQRLLSMCFNYAEQIAKQKGEVDTRKILSEFFDCAPLLSVDGSKWENPCDEAKKFAFKDRNYVERIATLGNIDMHWLHENANFMLKVLNVKSSKLGVCVTQQISDNELQQGKTKTSKKIGDPSEKKSREEEQEARQEYKKLCGMLLTILKNLPTYIFVSSTKSLLRSCDEIVQHARQHDLTFQQHVGVTVDVFEQLLPAIDKDGVNRCINDYTDSLQDLQNM